MRIPTSVIDEAAIALRRIIAGWGKQVARVEGVTLREGIATVNKRITVGGATVGLYVVATAVDAQGHRYTKYQGDDGRFYIEDHSTGQIHRV